MPIKDIRGYIFFFPVMPRVINWVLPVHSFNSRQPISFFFFKDSPFLINTYNGFSLWHIICCLENNSFSTFLIMSRWSDQRSSGKLSPCHLPFPFQMYFPQAGRWTWSEGSKQLSELCFFPNHLEPKESTEVTGLVYLLISEIWHTPPVKSPSGRSFYDVLFRPLDWMDLMNLIVT